MSLKVIKDTLNALSRKILIKNSVHLSPKWFWLRFKISRLVSYQHR